MPMDDTTQYRLDAFILRAGFTYGWRELESQARNMAEHAVEEQDAITKKLNEERSFSAKLAQRCAVLTWRLAEAETSLQGMANLLQQCQDERDGNRERLAVEEKACSEKALLVLEQNDRANAAEARLAEAVRMIEGYKRAGWLTNPAAIEQANDFIARAQRAADSAEPRENDAHG